MLFSVDKLCAFGSIFILGLLRPPSMFSSACRVRLGSPHLTWMGAVCLAVLTVHAVGGQTKNGSTKRTDVAVCRYVNIQINWWPGALRAFMA